MAHDVTRIDQAIAAANARKAARGEQTTQAAAEQPKASRKPRLTDEDKQARAAARQAELDANKAKRAEARAAKQAVKDAAKPTAHLRKVQKAAERLPSLGQAATLLFNEARSTLSGAELAALALHIQHANREASTVLALRTRFEVGQRVRIASGDPRYVGMEGTVTKVQRIRAYVSCEGVKKPVYVFTSDIGTVEPQAAAASNG
jgi:hypothetical protein